MSGGVPESIVCWRWKPLPGYRSRYDASTVNILRRMVARYFDRPHRFLCVTDDPKGLDRSVEVIKPWNDFAQVPSPANTMRAAKRVNPSCYRRLRAFHPEIASVFGRRFVSLDLDVVITGDLVPVWDRPEDFVIWGDTNPRTFYNGSMFLLTAGARSQVWTSFDPIESPKAAWAAGHFGSDQGWYSHCLGPYEATWTTGDGVYSFRKHLAGETAEPARHLPVDARVVIFHGRWDPWSPFALRLPWVHKHWR